MEVRVSRASSVIVHRVPPGSLERFQEWQRGISTASAEFPGYEATDIYAPTKGEQDWVIILHFNQPEAMQRWLKSPTRAQWLAKLQGIEADFQLKTLPRGFGAWFAQGAVPPGWKMVLTVVLGLYPTVMLLTLFVNPYSDRLGRAASILIGCALSVCLLQWVVVPALRVLLARWLWARGRQGRALTICGLVLILLALGAMWLLFHAVTDPKVPKGQHGAAGPVHCGAKG